MHKMIVALVGFGLIGFGLTAQAENYEGRTEVGASLGGMVFEGDSALDASHPMAGGRVGYYLTDEWAAEASILAGEADVKDSEENADLLLPAVEAQYHLCNSNFRPFLAAGIGVLDADGPDGGDVSDVAFPIGGGFKWMLTDNIDLRFDARWLWNTAGGDETHQGVFTGGIGWLFGGSGDTAPAQEAADDKGGAFPDAAAALARDKKVSIDLMVNFDFDKSVVKPVYMGRIMEFAQFMKEHPGTTAVVEGHTDGRGTKAYNDALSMRRANAVREKLVTEGGVAANRLSAKGYGFSQPIAENGTDAGRAKNRRVIGTVVAN